MYYPYRWFYLSLIFLMSVSLTTFFYLYPAWQQLIKFKSQEKDTLNVLRQLSRDSLKQTYSVGPPSTVLAHASSIMKQPDLMESIVTLLYQYGLASAKIDFASDNASSAIQDGLVHLSFKSNFAQGAGFLTALKGHAYPLNFSYKIIAPNQLAVLLDIKLLKDEWIEHQPQSDQAQLLTMANNPFCLSEEAIANEREEYHSPAHLQTVPLQLIQMVGFFQTRQSSICLGKAAS